MKTRSWEMYETLGIGSYNPRPIVRYPLTDEEGLTLNRLAEDAGCTVEEFLARFETGYDAYMAVKEATDG
jgi:hypothetical protein